MDEKPSSEAIGEALHIAVGEGYLRVHPEDEGKHWTKQRFLKGPRSPEWTDEFNDQENPALN